MAKAIFICNECKDKKEIFFEVGKIPEAPICEKCKKLMKRVFGKIESGDVVEDDMLHLGQTMLYS